MAAVPDQMTKTLPLTMFKDSKLGGFSIGETVTLRDRDILPNRRGRILSLAFGRPNAESEQPCFFASVYFPKSGKEEMAHANVPLEDLIRQPPLREVVEKMGNDPDIYRRAEFVYEEASARIKVGERAGSSSDPDYDAPMRQLLRWLATTLMATAGDGPWQES